MIDKREDAAQYFGGGTALPSVPQPPQKTLESYDDLKDKPKINGVELKGNVTPEQIGAAPKVHTHEDLAPKSHSHADLAKKEHSHAWADTKNSLEKALSGDTAEAGTALELKVPLYGFHVESTAEINHINVQISSGFILCEVNFKNSSVLFQHFGMIGGEFRNGTLDSTYEFNTNNIPIKLYRKAPTYFNLHKINTKIATEFEVARNLRSAIDEKFSELENRVVKKSANGFTIGDHEYKLPQNDATILTAPSITYKGRIIAVYNGDDTAQDSIADFYWDNTTNEIAVRMLPNLVLLDRIEIYNNKTEAARALVYAWDPSAKINKSAIEFKLAKGESGDVYQTYQVFDWIKSIWFKDGVRMIGTTGSTTSTYTKDVVGDGVGEAFQLLAKALDVEFS